MKKAINTKDIKESIKELKKRLQLPHSDINKVIDEVFGYDVKYDVNRVSPLVEYSPKTKKYHYNKIQPHKLTKLK